MSDKMICADCAQEERSYRCSLCGGRMLTIEGRGIPENRVKKLQLQMRALSNLITSRKKQLGRLRLAQSNLRRELAKSGHTYEDKFVIVDTMTADQWKIVCIETHDGDTQVMMFSARVKDTDVGITEPLARFTEWDTAVEILEKLGGLS